MIDLKPLKKLKFSNNTLTVISTFYNEEYLLPFWLMHHVKVFDYGILINHKSSDNSLKIIKKYAPHWVVIDSELNEFDPYITDFEVQAIESVVNGWKIALNISEFISVDYRDILKKASSLNINAIETRGRYMIDLEPNKEICLSESLFKQKPWFIKENALLVFLFNPENFFRKLLKLIFFKKTTLRSRLLHRDLIGRYSPGRHKWKTHSSKVYEIFIHWYGFSPWTNNAIARKVSFKSKIPKNIDGKKSHHNYSLLTLKIKFNMLRVMYFIFGNKL